MDGKKVSLDQAQVLYNDLRDRIEANKLNAFIATRGVTTYAEVTQAITDKKAVFAYDGTNLYTYATTLGSTYVFVLVQQAWLYLPPTIKALWLSNDPQNPWNEHDVDVKLAALDSPTFTGTPQITTTPATGDDTHKIADTAFVQQELAQFTPATTTFMQKGVDYVTAGAVGQIGAKATAEGSGTDASGQSSHAEGIGTTASQAAAHAEGYYSIASGAYSHAEGSMSEANAENAHAEGNSAIATGNNSHAEGMLTTANGRSQHVFGEYNTPDYSALIPTDRGTYVEIVGNGTSGASSNARTLDWNGNEVLAGKLTVGAAPTANMDVATKKYVDDAIAAAIAALQ